MDIKGVIVFDVGGTYLRFNILNQDFNLIEDISVNKIKSPSFHRYPNYSGDALISALIDQITKSVTDIKQRNVSLKIVGIGISFPGPIDSKGNIISAPTLWGDIVHDYPLKNILEKIFPYKIFPVNLSTIFVDFPVNTPIDRPDPF